MTTTDDSSPLGSPAASPRARDLERRDLSHTLAPVRALGIDGEEVRLGTLWEDQPAMLVFLRHFG